jgi:hypothetical protein
MFLNKPMEPPRNDTSIILLISVIICLCLVQFTGPPVSSNNNTDRYDIIEIVLKVDLNTITKANQTSYKAN